MGQGNHSRILQFLVVQRYYWESLYTHTPSQSVPIDKELVPVRVYEIEGEIESLFNGCILDSSSDKDDPTYTWNGAKDLTEENDEDLEE
ncbi:hypothetical protein Tco_0658479 [Tanacetum coccineum]